MKKIIFVFVAVILTASFVAPISGAEGRVKAYYSGSAVYYSGYVVVATANSGLLEVFKIKDGSNLTKFVGLTSYDQGGAQRNFNDTLLRSENGHLYVYAVNGRALYKYDITDLKQAHLIKRVEDTSWDWFGSLTVIGGRLSTVGSKGVKLWNNDLAVVDNYDLVNTGNGTYNVTPAESNKFLFDVSNGKIVIFDRDTRKQLQEVPLTFNWNSDWFKRSIYNDKTDDAVYVVDDTAVRKINFDGEIIKSFQHTGVSGYDVAPSADGRYIYFSDGIGIVKLRKSDLKVVASQYTTTVGAAGGWAMGLRTVQTDKGEQLVIFNTTSIIVLDSNLKQVKTSRGGLVAAQSTVEEKVPDVIEPLSLGIDKNHAAVGSTVLLHGAGFGKSEDLIIDFGGTQLATQANSDGRFSETLVVPVHVAGPAEIKVSGVGTGFHYNIGFVIE